jgi:iron-sulfur cluster assembly protein/iron-sulfur cluster insertion protein
MSESTAVEKSESVLNLTDRAIGQIRSMWDETPGDQGKPLRVYVEQGGCSGMQYGLVFDEVREGDAVHDFAGVSVVVDADSAGFLQGSTVDFSDDLMSGGFKVTNPRAKQNCGCGRSFEA